LVAEQQKITVLRRGPSRIYINKDGVAIRAESKEEKEKMSRSEYVELHFESLFSTKD
jgi:hypothetical protein